MANWLLRLVPETLYEQDSYWENDTFKQESSKGPSSGSM